MRRIFLNRIKIFMYLSVQWESTVVRVHTWKNIHSIIFIARCSFLSCRLDTVWTAGKYTVSKQSTMIYNASKANIVSKVGPFPQPSPYNVNSAIILWSLT
jgi:hypothetical protein